MHCLILIEAIPTLFIDIRQYKQMLTPQGAGAVKTNLTHFFPQCQNNYFNQIKINSLSTSSHICNSHFTIPRAQTLYLFTLSEGKVGRIFDKDMI